MIRLCAAAVAILLATACGRSGPKVLARYHPPAGAVYHYLFTQENLLTIHSGPLAGTGKRRLAVRMHFTQVVKGPALGGGTEIQVVFDSTSMEMPVMSPDTIARQLARMRGFSSTVVFDERGEVVRTDFATVPGVTDELLTQMSAGIKGMTVGFPEEAIGPGDSWTVDTEVGGQFGQFAVTRGTRASPTRMTFTVKRVVVSPSDTTVELRIKTVPPVGPIQLNVGGQRARLKLSGELSGKQRFSLTRGAVVDGTMGGVMKMDISMPALASLAMAITSQLQSTLRLQGAP